MMDGEDSHRSRREKDRERERARDLDLDLECPPPRRRLTPLRERPAVRQTTHTHTRRMQGVGGLADDRGAAGTEAAGGWAGAGRGPAAWRVPAGQGRGRRSPADRAMRVTGEWGGGWWGGSCLASSPRDRGGKQPDASTHHMCLFRRRRWEGTRGLPGEERDSAIRSVIW